MENLENLENYILVVVTKETKRKMELRAKNENVKGLNAPHTN